MLNLVSADEAVRLIKDGDCIALNSFVGIENPVDLHEAIHRRYRAEGSPAHLTLISAAGFGVWDRDRSAEGYIRDGACDVLICGHFGAMLSTKELVLEDRFEAYNLPLGSIEHAIRAQAGGLPGSLSKVGLGLFVDPDLEGPAINRMSRGTELSRKLVQKVTLDGEEFLYTKLPRITAALIKASKADRFGNVSLCDEYLKGDALSIAQAAKANGGTVLVQVDEVTDEHIHAQLVDIPACLVDAVCVSAERETREPLEALKGGPAISRAELPAHLDAINALTAAGKKQNAASDIIGERASRELRAGDVVNVGIGIPESVSKYAEQSGLMEKITMTVESGATGGLPASGTVFGSMIGADSVYTMAQQFDFYNGGGLDICFMGGLEADRFGNVNAHRGPGAFSGVGGFSNITCNTRTVVFCMTFNTKGLKVSRGDDGSVAILQEGSVPKFVGKVRSISFSGESAVRSGQRVLYVTERCVFELTEKGMKILEVYPGIDAQKDIIEKLPAEFAAELEKNM